MSKNFCLDVKDLSKDYTDNTGFNVHLLEDVTFTAGANSVTAILAPTGAGKSSLLKIIAGLEFATTGTIVVESEKRKLIYIPSKPSSFPWFNVKENINLVKKDGVDFDEIIRLVGLEGYEEHNSHNRSEGFRLRITLARALAVEGDIIILDEPFNNMPPHTRERLYKVILNIKEKTNVSFLLGTTNLTETLFLSDEVYIMRKNPGKIIDSVQVEFGEERNLDIMNSSAFLDYRTRIENILKQDKSQLLSNITI